MKTDRRKSGVSIRYSDDQYRLSSVSTRRSRSAPENDSIDDFLALALTHEQDMQLVDTVHLEQKAPTTRSRAAAPDDGTLALKVPLEPEEDAIVLLEQDGMYTWCLPESQGGGRRQRRRRDTQADGERTAEFELDLSHFHQYRLRGRRSLGGRLSSKAKAFIFRFTGEFASGAAIKMLERNAARGIVWIKGPELTEWEHLDDFSSIKLKRAAKVLLLVHGTFSTTVGSYGPLATTPWGRGFIEDCLGKYDAIVGFDHPTLSLDPLENALELGRLLREAGWANPSIDAVAYSRGGLVLRSLIEHVLPNEDSIDGGIARAVFVGATNGGTELAQPENWHALVDLYTNLAVGASRLFAAVSGMATVPLILNGLVKTAGALAKYLATTTVSRGGIPGLAAMEPQGDFVKSINELQPGQPTPEDIDYYAIISNFDSGSRPTNGHTHPNGLPRRLLMSLADRVVDQLMGSNNDLVVNTSSMTNIDPIVTGYVKDVCDFGSNPLVYHTVYFVQPETIAALRKWLGLPEAKAVIADAMRRVRSNGNGKAQHIDGFDEPVALEIQPATYRSIGSKSKERAEVVRDVREVVNIDVVWGDIRKVTGHVYAVGHYVGVLPQRAERALDKVVSRPGAETDELVLTRYTREGLLRGSLGEIDFFPWAKRKNRLVAVCGMGHPGTFAESELRILHRNLAWAVNGLPDARTLCMVLIGSGEGSLSVESAVRGLLEGLGDALDDDSPERGLRSVKIVELYKRKADEIHGRLMALSSEAPVHVKLKSAVTVGQGGLVSREHNLSMVLASVARATRRKKTTADYKAARKLLLGARAEGSTIEEIEEVLQSVAMENDNDIAGIAGALSITVEKEIEGGNMDAPPTRIAFTRRKNGFSVSAISDTTTVAERIIDVDPALVAELVRRMTDPPSAEIKSLSDLLFKLMVPRDFRDLLAEGSRPLVLEVDRGTAIVHWEFLANQIDERRQKALGVCRPVSRQLRTTYSPPPVVRSRKREGLSALVVGDPDDSLPGARDEAFRIEKKLREHGVEVTTVVGAPDDIGQGPITGYSAASRLEVLQMLMSEHFDIVHYSGHGDYDIRDPSKTGWLFLDGMLTAREIERIDRAPSLVIANACLSGMTSGAVRGGDRQHGDAGLLPSLADEFFKRGVRNYIGSAWEIDDEGAIVFAEKFYDEFLGAHGGQGVSIGQAVLAARKQLEKHTDTYDGLWGAYQHYGDPLVRARDL